MNKKIEGTVFDFGAEDGSWFSFFTSKVNDDGTIDYDEPEVNAGRVCLKPIDTFIESYFDKRKKESKFVRNDKSRAMERVQWSKDQTASERKAYQAALWDHAITSWENFFDGKKKPIECTIETKTKMMKVPMFDRFISKCLKTMGEDTVKRAEDLTENL